ncbi:hypothetical protein PLICRDRAFT_54825 [Plicaturopsis crispa FD-325 SS-3]|nr:hypothetical protein PLICRDRAFT_54825 [Plicaturopsis crispa FD-325 SS-3]
MASSHTSDSTFVAVVAVVGLVGVVLIMLIGRNRRGRARWMREWDEAQAARERTRQRPQLWDTWVRDDRADVCDTKLEDTKWENILPLSLEISSRLRKRDADTVAPHIQKAHVSVLIAMPHPPSSPQSAPGESSNMTHTQYALGTNLVPYRGVDYGIDW